jgi:hypothetical protein
MDVFLDKLMDVVHVLNEIIPSKSRVDLAQV